MRKAYLIKVLGQDYKITFVRALQAKGFDGFCDCRNKEIQIDNSLKGMEKKQTLMHEIKHAFDFESGLYQLLDDQVLELTSELWANFMCQSFNWNLK